MNTSAVAIVLLSALLFQVPPAAWGTGVTDCSAPSAGVLSLQGPVDEAHGWYDRANVVVEGRVLSIAGPHGKRTFLMQVHSLCPR